jgi:pimeloyl-ACP methyl ester carboxylesterase
LFRVLVLIDPIFLPPAILEMVAINPETIERQTHLISRALNRRHRWQSRQAAFERFRQKEVFKRWSDEVLWDYVNNAIVENGAGEVELIYPREWEARFYSMPPTDVWEVLPRVTQPMLAIRATESITVFPEAWQLWQSLQPRASFVEIPDSGHMLIMERPSLVAESVLNYLQNYREGS